MTIAINPPSEEVEAENAAWVFMTACQHDLQQAVAGDARDDTTPGKIATSYFRWNRAYEKYTAMNEARLLREPPVPEPEPEPEDIGLLSPYQDMPITQDELHKPKGSPSEPEHEWPAGA